MQIIISKRQYNLLFEQPIGLGTVGGYDWQKPDAIMKGGEMVKNDPHFFLGLLQIVTKNTSDNEKNRQAIQAIIANKDKL